MEGLRRGVSGALICGAEPVAALVEQGVAAGNTAKVSRLEGSGEAQPFPNASFAAVSEFSKWHQVRHPSAAVKEAAGGPDSCSGKWRDADAELVRSFAAC